MKKSRFFAAALAAALLLTTAAVAADTTAAASSKSAYRLGGEVTVTATAFTAETPYLTVLTADKTALRLNVSDDTAVLNTSTGRAGTLEAVKTGDKVYAYYSPAMTRSIPAQTACEALVVGLTSEHAPAHLLTAEQVTRNADGSVTVLADNGGVKVTVSEGAAVTSYRTGLALKSTGIAMGTRFFAWYDVMALSYPGQAGTDKVVVLTGDNSEVTMVTQGDIAIGTARVENGVVMVPLRKAAEALGFTVTWDAQERTVRLTNGTVQTVVTPGEDLYYMATAIPGAVGMSAPCSLGASSYLKNGACWAPAELFNLLLGGETVQLQGTTLYL